MTEETAASGRRSLKITDAAGLKNGFDPHFYYSPRYDKGAATCSFAIRVEPGAVFYHEWRDGSIPYRVGPSVWFRDGKVFVGGRAAAVAPAGKWLRVTVESRLDVDRPTWTLTVAAPDAPPVKLADLPVADGWRSVGWVGFVSPAEHPTAVHLDDLELNVRP